MQQKDNVGLASSQVIYNNNKTTTGNGDLTMTTATATSEHSAPPVETAERDESPHDKPIDTNPDALTLSDLIGEYGLYQLSLTLITFIRYVYVAMMTNTGPLIAPWVEFSCIPPANLSASGLSIIKQGNITISDHLKGKCSLKLSDGSEFKCSSWSYNLTEHGTTLTDSFDLVCDRDWLRSTFQGTVSIGVVVAAVLWGTFSDRHGRNLAVKVSYFCSLLSGYASYLASNLLVFTVSRAICTFSDIGLVVSLSTIIVETLGNKYRGAVCIIVYTGWAVGVMVMPWLTEYFRDFRLLMLFMIVYHIMTLPWLLTIKESVRWSLVNGYINEAGEELKRISRWNLKGDKRSIAELESKFEVLKTKYVVPGGRRRIQREMEMTNMSRAQVLYESTFGGFSKIKEVFQTRELTTTTTTLIWLTFNSELIYMLLILINSDVGDNVKLNYIIGGIMEIVATVLSIVLISYVTRRLSLISTFMTISCLCFAFSFKHGDPVVSVWLLSASKLAISNLSSLIYVTTTESFPTDLRQTGFGTVGTFGSLGAVVAPFIREELVNLIGMSYVMLIIVVSASSAALIIPFLLRETKGVELADGVDDFETDNFDSNLRRRGSSISKWNPTILAVERV